MSTKAQVKAALQAVANPEKAAFFPRFFKTGPGQYGEGDRFLGVTVPQQRVLARRFQTLALPEIAKLLDDPLHECRLTGLLILVDQFRRGDEAQRRELADFYCRCLPRINNWDLVDSSAPYILGAFLADKDRSCLDELADSGDLWRQRVAIVATFHFIRQNEFADTLRIAQRLLRHEHDLIHKAVGWMLREVGKRDVATLERFLDCHAHQMPRTMLRYAIERLPEGQRQRYLRQQG